MRISDWSSDVCSSDLTGPSGLFDADPGTPGQQLAQFREVSFDEITGRAVLAFEVTPDNSLYASYSRGYKSGGINPPLSPIFAVSESFGSRSEEHTSELQSLMRNSYAVFCLQKKNKYI